MTGSTMAPLAPVQQRGRQALERLGLPNRGQEDWRLTNLKRLETLARLPLAKAPSDIPLPSAPDAGLRLVLDGVHDPLDGVSLPNGLSSLPTAELQ